MQIEVKNLCVAYEGTEMVHDVSFSLGEGEVLSIVGESGSGKTTVIRAMIGCLPSVGKVTGGQILFDGKDMTQASDADWRKVSGGTAAMIFQDSGSTLDPIQTIGQQFVEYIQTHSKISTKEAEEKAKDMFSKVNLEEPEIIMKSYPHQLSGGMKQRVGIAMALTFCPKIILADEPTSALDVITQAQIVKEIMDLRKKFDTSIIMVTHNLGVAAYISDKIIVMQNGKIVDAGNKNEVIENPKSEYTKKLLEAVPEIGGERLV